MNLLCVEHEVVQAFAVSSTCLGFLSLKRTKYVSVFKSFNLNLVILKRNTGIFRNNDLTCLRLWVGLDVLGSLLWDSDPKLATWIKFVIEIKKSGWFGLENEFSS